MKLFVLLVVLVVMCKGNHMMYRQLLDLLRRHELTELKRHEVTGAKRHEVTGAKRHEVTGAKRHEVTAAKRHEFTAAKRHGVTAAMRQWPESPSRYDPLTTAQPSVDYPHENEFSEIEEAFLFPGSHYLIDVIRSHCESDSGLKFGVGEINDEFQLPQSEMNDFRKILLVLKDVEDPEGVALLVVRKLVKPFLLERMKCPATILDMGLVKTFLRMKHKFMDREDASLFTFFKEMAPLIDPNLGPFADEIAASGVHELHGVIFNETMEFLWKYSLKDLAFATHSVFHHLHYFFDDLVRDMDYSERVTEFKEHVETGSSGIRCPSSAEMIDYHRIEVNRFRNVFGIIETGQICLKVADFITRFVENTMSGYLPNLENNMPLNSVCDGIKVTIDAIVEAYASYEEFLFTMKIPDLELLLAEVLTDEEWELVEEALRKLGFNENR